MSGDIYLTLYYSELFKFIKQEKRIEHLQW